MAYGYRPRTPDQFDQQQKQTPISALSGPPMDRPTDPGPLGSRTNQFKPPIMPLGMRYGYGYRPRDPSQFGRKLGFPKNDQTTMGDRPVEVPPPPRGSESGPGILESWFNQRAQGIDAASQYATKRGLDALNDRYAAGGMANSGAARQGDADLLANIEAQRAGALDALAAGASGEHQRRLDSMFGQGLGLAGGQSQINSIYDIKAGDAQSEAIKAALGFFLNKAGVDDKSRQQGLSNIFSLIGLM